MFCHSLVRSSGVIAAVLLAGAVAHAQTPSHVYDLNGSLADALGGPAITNNSGGVLGANGVSFGINQGLSLSGVLTSATYSVETQFRLTDTAGYRKLIDFLNRTSDSGLYNFGGAMTFYPGLGNGFANSITPNTSTHLVITRDGVTNAFTGYVNGVSQFSFIDNTGASLFSGPNNIAYFFIDDVTNGGEASAGFVDYVRTYNTPLTQAEVSNRFANRDVTFVAVPEPGSVALLVSAAPLPLAILARRRRKQGSSLDRKG